MAVKKLRSIKGRRLRLTALDECGVPDTVGTCASIVTEGFITVTWSLEVEEGEEYTQKNAWGDFCISEKDSDRIKWVNVSFSLCEIDPGILQMVGGGNAVTNGADTIGATFGQEPNPLAFGVEVWTKMAGAGACSGGTPEWGYFVTPYVRNGMLDGDITVENGPLSSGLKGEAIGASDAWGVGPYGDNPMLNVAGFPAGDIFGLVTTTVQPPAVTVGCVALPPE
jgi:hypothetical protein